MRAEALFIWHGTQIHNRHQHPDTDTDSDANMETNRHETRTRDTNSNRDMSTDMDTFVFVSQVRKQFAAHGGVRGRACHPPVSCGTEIQIRIQRYTAAAVADTDL